MKRRYGFVANSSSHTYILNVKVNFIHTTQFFEHIEKKLTKYVNFHETKFIKTIIKELYDNTNPINYEKFPEQYFTQSSFSTHFIDNYFFGKINVEELYHFLLVFREMRRNNCLAIKIKSDCRGDNCEPSLDYPSCMFYHINPIGTAIIIEEEPLE